MSETRTEVEGLTTYAEEAPTPVARIAIAEFIGTMVLVLGGCGTAILAGEVVGGTLGVSIAFGLTVLCMAYAIGHISGCHINPAVTVGLWLTGKCESRLVPVYFISQFLGGLLGALVIFGIASGQRGFEVSEAAGGTFASNGWDANDSPFTYGFWSMVIVEVVLTALFVAVVIGTTQKRFPLGFGGLAAGLMLALVHLISIPVDNTSVNPARSFAVAVFRGDWALTQVWAFIVFPVIGAIVAGVLWKVLAPEEN